ncbi:glycosyltransferase family 4 protein [Thiotrichales bacterium 19S9-12]|nr:glycosyltransferase family 4 protein [Thiotrichales bacterium 19S9-11]MCF6811751.1 glycosyltransferase family 4 protein [Thiotrichales bacterium 19S9-12]
MSKPLKIAIVSFWGNATNLSASVPKLIFDQAVYLQKKGYIVEVYSKDDSPDTIFHSIPYRFFKENKLLNRILNKWFRLNYFTFNNLVKKINNYNPDIIHIHNRQALVDSIVNKLKNPNTKIVTHYHRNFGNPVIPKKAHALIAVSNSTKNWIENKLHKDDRFHVVYNCVFSEVLKLKNKIKPINSKNENIKILYSGGFQKNKGYYDLIEALKLTDKEFKLYICGAKADQIKNINDDRVSIIGELAFHEFFELMRNCDIVLIPSHFEGLPLTALEAIALDRILVCSDADGINEITHNNNTIIQFKKENPEALAKAIDKVINLISKQYSINAYTTQINQLINNFYPECMVNKLDKLYNHLTNERIK